MRLRSPRRLVALLILALGLAPRTAAAQGSDAAIAEALFQEGRRLMAQQKIDEACPKFEESHRLAPKLGTLLNLATCHDKQGKSGSAWGELTEAISLAKQAGEADRVAYARRLLDDLEKRLTRIVVEVPSPVEGQEVAIDGKVIGAAAYRTPLPVDPGEHEVKATAPGHEPWSTRVSAAPGPATVSVEVPALQRAAAEPPAPAPPPPPRAAPPAASPADEGGGPSGQLVAGLVVGGVGLVGLGVGSVFGILTFDRQGESEDHCVEERCDATGVALREDAASSATISTIAFAVGAAAVAGGLVLVLTAPGERDGTSSASIAPRVGPDGAGLSLHGGFW